jgi:V8-like Glu-specific endopeptidase
MRRDINVVDLWRRRLGLCRSVDGGAMESGSGPTDLDRSIEERIVTAREMMRRSIMDEFGGDAALLEAVERIATDGSEAVAILESTGQAPEPEQIAALEAIVSFDGTRPSFLIRHGRVDLESSVSTSQWKTTLSPRLEKLADLAACVGRVEIGQSGIGTGFLVAPTLALTNRHVAQAFANFRGDRVEIHSDTFLDFGREHRGRASYDRRKVQRVLFAGCRAIEGTINHDRLDLALVEVTGSQLTGERRDRALQVGTSTTLEAGIIIAAIGYPGGWRHWVPAAVRSEHANTLARLLDGDGATKRLSPGESQGMLKTATGQQWTTCHDATTINGNSGSPLILPEAKGAPTAVGLHYGGRWGGEGINWAHFLGACLDAPVTTGETLRGALRAHGIVP